MIRLMIFPFMLILSACQQHEVRMVDFKKINLSQKPNHYLICPKNYCNVEPDTFSLTYSVPVDALQFAFKRMIADQPRVKLIQFNQDNYHFQYVQYSRIFKFPDDIDVQFISLEKNHSTLAIYSRARYGYYDFNVNRHRIDSWLSQLPHYFK